MKVFNRFPFFLILFSTLYSCTPKTPSEKTSEFTMNTSAMQEYPIKLSDSSINILNVVAVFPSDKKKPNSGITPNADVYVLRFLIGANTDLNDADTIAVLDTALQGPIGNIILKNYWANVDTSTTFKSCKVKLSQKDFEKLKKYKYQYGKVTMVTDD
jgi:hypothetical protein